MSNTSNGNILGSYFVSEVITSLCLDHLQPEIAEELDLISKGELIVSRTNAITCSDYCVIHATVIYSEEDSILLFSTFFSVTCSF